jgi:STE24 endopeptidase
MTSIFPDFLSSARWNLALFPLFAVFAGIFSVLLFGPLGLALSRRFESRADRYALENISAQTAFATALAGLADRNLSNAYPSWWVKILFYSHPPIGERLKAADDFQRKPGR